ncbi:copper amine oxidase N-terminal domain-containing protein [Heliorestis acidaminivorans]|uniref:Copper amine oxidase N-terminal domain-containing protein n=1 Tax=Heliorestis acidaminivorans TaxID=553427 RepID=A0A6I0F2K1_9FIRM|nr:stalk domain-containing protein [Heliorestis acidaminivorans]KAB2953780.1 copper amine oxidase N-terminal domain-containing protein [Heliorestis acidaminivorans]
MSVPNNNDTSSSISDTSKKQKQVLLTAVLATSLLIGGVTFPAVSYGATTCDLGNIYAKCQLEQGVQNKVTLQFPNNTYDQSIRLQLERVESSRLTAVDAYHVTRAVEVRMTNRSGQTVNALSKSMRLKFDIDEIDFRRASDLNTNLPITRFRIGYWDESEKNWTIIPSTVFWNGQNGSVEAETNRGAGRYALLWSKEASPQLSQQATDQIRLMVNYAVVNPERAPFVKDERTLVPLRIISTSLGARVNWNSQEQKIDIVRGRDTVNMWIGKSDVVKNGQPLALESAQTAVPEIVGDTTFVPLRLVADALGVKVDWDALTRTVHVLE